MSGGPFRRLRGVALVAAVYAVAAVVWVAAGAWLPGGRWLAIHLFTLGMLTNVVLGLTDHFARTLTHQDGGAPWWQPVVVNAGVLAVLWGIPAGERWSVAVGATVVAAVVFLAYLRLRGLRRAALAPRFGWVVRMYERAHGAFLHGAVLGGLVGTGVLSGTWYLAGRTAHFHVMLLGWGGLTLLATMVFFGPTVARIRIESGADARAARALRWGATGLTLAVLAILATGIGGVAATVLRLAAAAGLGFYAWAAGVVCLPVLRAVWRAKPSAGRWSVLAAAAWFLLVAWGDVAAVAIGAGRPLDALGVAFLVGVLAQAILGALAYLAPMFRDRDGSREGLRDRLETLGGPRAAAWNVGVALAALAALVGPSEAGTWLARTGWALVIAAAVAQFLLTAVGWRASVRA